ncbi:MAG: hypothetical protein COT67_02895 [Candidatus Tagabacteria bacterium CG09_land_8_20_14_0_10_41_14]|uniref:SMC-Scp complex subunit ScpB n=2 Tax=Candidatus Tagaibacteriota TaxID=1817918 RepID=A0A2H0WMQ4_9BACT|nr:MAG: hypothetical protein COT67_02895 [Candidatus Tagabacteria bacterium CG09_land_8_20_14_0_10_41_14]PJE72964.1 MAG: hypothetical protein COV00_02645 [Candidatus Tagabacteria bacterium CG10_big_fil_rev_8_21_14_0_10_40_13]
MNPVRYQPLMQETTQNNKISNGVKLSNHIEALLFLSGEPLAISRLTKVLGKKEEEIEKSVSELDENLKERGLRLIKNKDKIMLGAAPESSKYCEALLKEELNKNIGKAGLETLAIIIYKGGLNKEGVTRSEIDYIRGVNSTFTLRNLMIRGLIEREINPKDKRVYTYSASTQLFQYLGITKPEDLPEYAKESNGNN